jgi:hypothetical protein
VNATDALAIVRRYHEVLNAFDANLVKPMIAPDATYHSPAIGVLAGRDAILQSMSAYFAEYPDQHSIDDSMDLVAPQVVRSVWRLAATSRSSGKAFRRAGVEHVTLNAQGQILRVEVSDT